MQHDDQQSTERTPYHADDYASPERGPSDEDRLDRFIVDTLAPQSARIREMHLAALHKGELYNVGRLAQHLRWQIGETWLPLAQKLLTERTHDETERAYVARVSEKQGKVAAERLPVDVTKTEVKSRIASLQRKVDVLKNVRDDLAATVSFVQTALNRIADEEIGELE